MDFYCCLKDTFRPDPLSASYCDSGYQNPRCTLTSSCTLNVYGTSLAVDDSVLIVDSSSCGDASGNPLTWSGIQNPQVAASVSADSGQFDMGQALTGEVGEYSLCYKAGGADSLENNTAENYTVRVGSFTMRGPTQGHDLSCTLGTECLINTPGVDLYDDPARYKLRFVYHDGSSSPCVAGASEATFLELQMPDNVEDDNTDDTFRMGIPFAGDTLSSYAACWSDDPSSLADYTHYIGNFTVNGPTSTSEVCTMGLACTITLQGTGFAADNALLLGIGTDPTTLCRYLTAGLVGDFGSAFANPSRPVGAALGSYSMGTTFEAPLNTPGSGYRLCWASFATLEPPATENSDYQIDAGGFTLHGPVLADQACSLSLTCELQLSGSGLSTMSYGVLVVAGGQICGDASAVPADVSGRTWLNPASGDATGVVVMGLPADGLASGSLSACWGAWPAGTADYRVTLGVFTMSGPDALVGTTCTKGVDCTLTITGTGLASGNRVLLLEPSELCGNSDAVTTFSPFENEKLANQDGIYERYELGFADSGTAQTGYTICWGANPSAPTDFTVTIGDFTLTGPNERAMTCYFGLQCQVQLTGFSLSSTNRLIVLLSGQCGDNQPVFVTLDGMLNTAGVEATAPYETYDLLTPVAGDPGTYQVCWGDSPGVGGSPDFYRVPVGLLTVNGPVQVPQHCTLSTACSLQLTGTGLSNSNRVLIISDTFACGNAAPTLGGFSHLVNPQGPLASDAGAYELGVASDAPLGVGSSYSICWAHAPTSLEEYIVTLGSFTMSGPDDVPMYTCTLGLPCELTLTGHNLADTNTVVVTAFTDTCGQVQLNVPTFGGMANPSQVVDSSPWTEYSLGLPVSGLPGDYAVCWSHHGGAHSEFDVRVATLRMGGPTPADRECTLSEPCTVALEGVRLAHTSRLLIISTDSTCGDGAPIYGDWLGVLNPASTALLATPDDPGYNYSDGDTYNLGLSHANAPSRNFQMCWAFDPTADGGDSDYKVPVGSFVMNGPAQNVQVSCTMGQPCNVELSGLALNGTNIVQLIAGTGLCGSNDDDVEQAALVGFRNPCPVTDDASDTQYSFGMVTVGGAYSICRVPTPASSCIGSHYRLCWAHGLHTTAEGHPNFVVEVGSFTMSGPFVAYSVECVLGTVCAFALAGSAFQPSNRVMVIHEDGTCGDADPPLAYFEGLQNPAIAADVISGSEAIFRLGRSHAGQLGTYRLCWAADPLVQRHYNIEVGPFIFRGMPDGCFSRDGFIVECA